MPNFRLNLSFIKFCSINSIINSLLLLIINKKNSRWSLRALIMAFANCYCCSILSKNIRDISNYIKKKCVGFCMENIFHLENCQTLIDQIKCQNVG